MKVVMANDHGAVGLKKRLCAYLTSKGISVVNLGTDEETAVDYPDMAEKACAEYLTGGYDFGILLCGTGIGMSIAANKIDGIRAALPQNAFAARMAKEHNNADFLVFGGRIDYVDSPEMMIDAFIGAEFAGGRHLRRIEKTTNAETGFKHIVMWSFKSSLTEDEKKIRIRKNQNRIRSAQRPYSRFAVSESPLSSPRFINRRHFTGKHFDRRKRSRNLSNASRPSESG